MGKLTFPKGTPFWDRITKTESGCWEWQGERDAKGYGRYYPKWKTRFRAHRYAYEQAHGPIPKDQLVLHRCDNPPCCNPEHLFLGTHQDNIRDKMRKGRGRNGFLLGIQNPGAKLNADQVREIRARSSGGETKISLARIYGVSNTVIGDIIRRKHYRDVE